MGVSCVISIEELIKFINKHGPIVIQQCYNNHNILEIEVYDDYRE